MSKQIYLLDANIFLTPIKHNYYNFNIAPGYWEQFNLYAKQGYIKTIDYVNDEIRRSEKEEDKDDIQLWFESEFNNSKEKLSILINWR